MCCFGVRRRVDEEPGKQKKKSFFLKCDCIMYTSTGKVGRCQFSSLTLHASLLYFTSVKYNRSNRYTLLL